MGKRKILESKKPKKKVVEKTNPVINRKNGIIVNFSCPLSFYSCKVKNEYTNYLKNPKEFINIRRKIFGEALDYFKNKTFDELSTRSKSTHTHKITGEKLVLVEKILNELVYIKWGNDSKDKIVGNYMSGDIWQLGYKNGIRLIGSTDDNIFNLLFIDYHHLIEPSKKYNNKDYFKYSYCPMKSDYCDKCR